ncbi:MAG: shikimate kinase AroL [Gemmataceae bacterium]|nr:shikimate kinase AroL [Gemmata sp.]MDW8196799.1 shikimate kinase AroL [Gemmataceae bacterium]
MPPPAIILIGARCTGKTTVARWLADQLGYPYVDVDEWVETQAGKTVAEIFATEGETGFRNRESAALQQICSAGPRVIATGGGVVLREANRRLIRSTGLVVWLTATPERLWERLQRDPATASRRPNLTATGGLEEIRALLTHREPLYREIADLVISTETLSPEAVADAILSAWTGGNISRWSSGACLSSSPG